MSESSQPAFSGTRLYFANTATSEYFTVAGGAQLQELARLVRSSTPANAPHFSVSFPAVSNRMAARHAGPDGADDIFHSSSPARDNRAVAPDIQLPDANTAILKACQ